MAKERKRITQATADQVMFDSDRICCMCRKRGRLQIHHIDEDPSNNELSNLAALCPNCHDDVGVKGGMGRQVSAGLILMHRDSLYDYVREEREALGSRRVLPSDTRDLINAVAIMDVRKIRYTLSGFLSDWDGVMDRLGPLVHYGREFSGEVRSEILEALSYVTHGTRHGMPESVAGCAMAVLDETLPLPFLSFHRSGQWTPSDEDVDLLSRGTRIAAGVAYDGAKFLGNLKIVDTSARVVATVLKYGHRFNAEDVREFCEEGFELMHSGAAQRKFGDATKWLDFLHEDALSDLQDPPIPIPKLETAKFPF